MTATTCTPDAPPMHGMRTPEAAKRVGVTFRQLDYWARSGIVTPTIAAQGSGSRRIWTAEDIEGLEVAARVARALHGDTPTGGVNLALVGAIYRAHRRGERSYPLGEGVEVTW